VVLKPTRPGLTRAAQLIRGGGVVAFPTDTVYGLGAAADDEIATKRVYRIKGRPAGMPLILMVAAESQLEGWVHIDSRTEALIRRWWPGPLTLILHAIGGGTLGVRIPKHKVALALLRAAEEAGALPGLAAVLDGGKAPGGMASTVLDLTGPEAHVLREGAISTPELLGPPPSHAG
jgi:L-threonylcarbamoyladenylate synthase